jgi:uncharacterized membrane protein YhiD involved in acid resistance
MRLDTPRAVLLAVVLFGVASGVTLAEDPPPAPEQHELRDLDQAAEDLLHELAAAAVRLPLAAALGAVLALRPRRRGSPSRRPVVIQTQIILAVVGAVIMLVVGASLARAFGIVGVASLVRYRSKVDDPKDAVVMLAALSVGLAAGVGLYALAVFSTLFLVATLAVIERFEPRTRTFELSVKLGERTAELRPRIEAVLSRFNIEHELRSASQEDVAYTVIAPYDIGTDQVTKALTSLVPDGKGAVEWVEKPKGKTTFNP